jgi:hypothetical protein
VPGASSLSALSSRQPTGHNLGSGLAAENPSARLLAWFCLYYDDPRTMFSPQISRRRQRIAIDGAEYWLVRVPKQKPVKRIGPLTT